MASAKKNHWTETLLHSAVPLGRVIQHRPSPVLQCRTADCRPCAQWRRRPSAPDQVPSSNLAGRATRRPSQTKCHLACSTGPSYLIAPGREIHFSLPLKTLAGRAQSLFLIFWKARPWNRLGPGSKDSKDPAIGADDWLCSMSSCDLRIKLSELPLRGTLSTSYFPPSHEARERECIFRRWYHNKLASFFRESLILSCFSLHHHFPTKLPLSYRADFLPIIVHTISVSERIGAKASPALAWVT